MAVGAALLPNQRCLQIGTAVIGRRGASHGRFNLFFTMASRPMNATGMPWTSASRRDCQAFSKLPLQHVDEVLVELRRLAHVVVPGELVFQPANSRGLESLHMPRRLG
jgi:hypothetical protein